MALVSFEDELSSTSEIEKEFRFIEDGGFVWEMCFNDSCLLTIQPF
jgi:hypothetical protein